MDEIKARLKDASDACLAKLETWRGKATDAAAREALQEALHELRKVTARIEIEMAVSDRRTQGSDPIPIPAHRASRRPGGDDMDDDNRSNHGNRAPHGQRDGNRAPHGGGGGGRPVQIRKPAEPSASSEPGNDAPAAAAAPAPAGEEDGARKRPLSLKRSSNADSE